jgi:hypothetical protein
LAARVLKPLRRWKLKQASPESLPIVFAPTQADWLKMNAFAGAGEVAFLQKRMQWEKQIEID